MTEFNPLELAKQGNPQAIADILGDNLKLLQIEITQSTLQDGCLNLILQGKEVPEQNHLVDSISRSINNIQPKKINKVKILACRGGEKAIAWSEEFTVASNQQKSVALPVSIGQQENKVLNTTDNRDRATQTENKEPKQSATNEFLETLRTFQFDSVVPYKEVFNSDLYKSNIVRILLFFSLFPWLVSSLASNSRLEDIAWILGVYYASIWGIVLYNLIKPAQFSWRNTLQCVAFTAFIGIPLLLFIQKVPPFSILYFATETSSWIFKLLGFVLGVGVLEEICKGFPVYFFMLRQNKLQEPLTAAFYGSMSGLGFAIAEGANYSILYALGLVQGNLNFGSYFLVNTVRFISLPLIHAIWAGIVGYFLGLAAINPSREKAIAFIGVVIAATLHGFYNTFANDLIGLVILTFSILLFVTYLRRSNQMVEEMKAAETNSTNGS